MDNKRSAIVMGATSGIGHEVALIFTRRAKDHMQEMSCALLSTGDERAYQNGDDMVGTKNDYLPSNCSHQTSDALKDKLQNKKGPAQADRSLY